MKKRLLVVCFLIAFVLSACGGASDSSSAPEDAEEETAVSEEVNTESGDKTESVENSEQVETEQAGIAERDKIEQGRWIVQQETDEFGDLVEGGDNYLVTALEGTFSNTATASSDLHVEVFMKDAGSADNDIWFFFYLYEYGDNPVTPLSSERYTMKIKDEDNGVYDFDLETVPNSNAIAFIDHGRADGKYMYERLSLGQSIKCIISTNTSKYNFTMESGNFTDACKEIGYDVYEDPSKIADVDTALKLLNEGKQFDYGDKITELLLPLIESIEPMSTEEIAEAIKPGNWSANDPQFSKHNVKYQFSEDGTYQEYKSIANIKHAWKVEDNSLQTALIRDGEPSGWTSSEVRKIKDGYYLIGSGEPESVGYDIKVLVEVDENFDPVYPIE